MGPQILVVGSVHADIVATYDDSTSANRDKIGEIRISVGGTAYNIAANLAYEKLPVALYTHVRDGSLTSGMIRDAIRSVGINDALVQIDPDLAESAFVAHSCSPGPNQPVDLVSAVSCVGIQYAKLDLSVLQRAMKSSTVAVVDCNLTSDQLTQVLQLARNSSIPVLISAASESKVGRLQDVARNLAKPFDVVAMNIMEARHLGLPDEFDDRELISLKAKCGASSLIVTHGTDGYYIAHGEADVEKFRNEPIPGVVNTLGAGDALLAAVVAHRVEHKQIDWSNCNTDIQSYVNRVLRNQDATPQSGTLADRSIHVSFWKRAELHAVILISVAAGLCIQPMFTRIEHPAVFGGLLFGTALFSGASGGLVHWIRQAQPGVATVAALQPLTLGMIAGFLSALFFTLAQMVTHGNSEIFTHAIPEKFNYITPFALLIAFVAGMTTDTVFGRLEKKDALNMHPPGGTPAV